MSEEELCREIKSGAFSMQVADCERNIRIQFEKLQQENKQLEENYDRIYNENCILREKHNINDIGLLDENYKLQKVIDKAIEYIEDTYYSKNTTDIDSIVLSNNELLKIRKILKEVE